MQRPLRCLLTPPPPLPSSTSLEPLRPNLAARCRRLHHQSGRVLLQRSVSRRSARCKQPAQKDSWAPLYILCHRRRTLHHPPHHPRGLLRWYILEGALPLGIPRCPLHRPLRPPLWRMLDRGAPAGALTSLDQAASGASQACDQGIMPSCKSKRIPSYPHLIAPAQRDRHSIRLPRCPQASGLRLWPLRSMLRPMARRPLTMNSSRMRQSRFCLLFGNAILNDAPGEMPELSGRD